MSSEPPRMMEQNVENPVKKAWQDLCQQAATEENPERLMTLVKEISRLLDEQLKQRRPSAA